MCDFSGTHLGSVRLRNNALLKIKGGKARTKKSNAQKRIFFVSRGGFPSYSRKVQPVK